MADDIIDALQIKIEKAKALLPDDTLNAINSVDWKTVVFGMREKHGYTFEQLGDLDIETELLLCGLGAPENYGKELESRMGITKAQANDLVNEMNKLVFEKIKGELIKTTERRKIFSTANAKQVDKLSDGLVKETTASGYSRFRTPSLEEIERRNRNSEIKKTTSHIFGSAGIKIIEKLNTTEKVLGKTAEILPVPEKLELTSDPAGTAKTEMINKEIEKPKENVDPIMMQKLSGSFKTDIVKTEHSLDRTTKVSPAMTDTPHVYPPRADPYRLPPE